MCNRNWQITTGAAVQSKDRGNYFLILLDQAKPNLISSRGITSDEILDEIARLLNTVDDPEIPIIIAGHYPLLKSTQYYSMTWHREMKNASRLRKMLGQSGKKIFYLCGHVHKHYCLEDPLYTNIIYISCAAPFSRKNGHKTLQFNEITINESQYNSIGSDELKDLVQGWLDGTETNNGITLLQDGNNDGVSVFLSLDNNDNMPRLYLEYYPP